MLAPKEFHQPRRECHEYTILAVSITRFVGCSVAINFVLTPTAFNGMIVCSTSFSGVDLLHVAKVVSLMGNK